MKVLQKVILGLGLVIGSVYAQDVSNTIHSPGYIKDYTVIIKPVTELKQGNNDINVNFIISFKTLFLHFKMMKFQNFKNQ